MAQELVDREFARSLQDEFTNQNGRNTMDEDETQVESSQSSNYNLSASIEPIKEKINAGLKTMSTSLKKNWEALSVKFNESKNNLLKSNSNEPKQYSHLLDEDYDSIKNDRQDYSSI